MKKQVLTLMIGGFLFATANAQDATTTATANPSATSSKFSMGPVVGAGWTNVSGLKDTKFKVGANAGVAMVYSASEHFGIGLDIKYSFEGMKQDVTDANNNKVNNNLNLNYVRVPLKAMYFFNNHGSSVRPKIFLGPSIGFLTSANLNAGSSSQKDVKDEVESTDFGMVGGVGSNFRLAPKTWLNLDLTYMQGLKNAYVSGTENHKNMNLFLNVGVNFGL